MKAARGNEGLNPSTEREAAPTEGIPKRRATDDLTAFRSSLSPSILAVAFASSTQISARAKPGLARPSAWALPRMRPYVLRARFSTGATSFMSMANFGQSGCCHIHRGVCVTFALHPVKRKMYLLDSQSQIGCFATACLLRSSPTDSVRFPWTDNGTPHPEVHDVARMQLRPASESLAPPCTSPNELRSAQILSALAAFMWRPRPESKEKGVRIFILTPCERSER